jgi:phenylacetic acid degradation operon negative regulatory protein
VAGPGRARSHNQANGGSAGFLLRVLLGEFMWPEPRSVRTATLIYVLGALGVDERTARQAIRRAAARGWIDSRRNGREVTWRLTEGGNDMIRAGARRVLSLDRAAGTWAGQWLVLVITVPSEERSTRRHLQARLAWAGFGSPQPGMWVSARPERREEAADIVAELGLREQTWSFVGSSLNVGLGDEELARRSWDLERASALGAELLKRYSSALPVGGDDVLLTYVRLLNDWYRLPYSMPQLPDGLLPDWNGRALTSRLRSLRNEWRKGALDRWDEIERSGL